MTTQSGTSLQTSWTRYGDAAAPTSNLQCAADQPDARRGSVLSGWQPCDCSSSPSSGSSLLCCCMRTAYEIMEKSSTDAVRCRFSRRNMAPRFMLHTAYVAACALVAAALPFFSDIIGVVDTVVFILLDFVLPVLYNMALATPRCSPVYLANIVIIVVFIGVIAPWHPCRSSRSMLATFSSSVTTSWTHDRAITACTDQWFRRTVASTAFGCLNKGRFTHGLQERTEREVRIDPDPANDGHGAAGQQKGRPDPHHLQLDDSRFVDSYSVYHKRNPHVFQIKSNGERWMRQERKSQAKMPKSDSSIAAARAL